MKQKKLRTESIPTVIDLEKNFILIMKPDDMIKSETPQQKRTNPNSARYMINQLFDEIEQRDILDSDQLRDIRYLLNDYFENNSSEPNTNYYNNEIFCTIDDDFEEQWVTPYDDDSQINLYY